MRRALVAAAAAVCLLAAGCGDGEETATTTSTSTAGGFADVPGETPSEPTGEDKTYDITRCDGSDCPEEIQRPVAEDVIELYFDSVSSGQLEQAWDQLSPEVHDQFAGFETWSYGIEQRESTELVALNPAGESGGVPAFDVEVHTVENTECGITADRTFTGEWTVDPDTQLIATADQTLVAGPPDLEVLCATSGY